MVIMKTDKEDKLEREVRSLIEPTIKSLGFEIYDICIRIGRTRLARVLIDSKNSVGVEDCANVSKEVEQIIDTADIIEYQYNLEVSSPGIERRLTKKEHFEKYIGECVDVVVKEKIEGRSHFKGKLINIDNNNCIIDIDNKTYEIDINNIEKAKNIFVFKNKEK